MPTKLGSLMHEPRVLLCLGMVGLPYYWGEGSPSSPIPNLKGYDCSGFAQAICVLQGTLRRDERDRTAHELAMVSDPVDEDAIEFGDLAFYGRKRITHVMVCIGGGWVVGARGGSSRTRGDDPRAFVDLKPLRYRSDLVVVGRLKTALGVGSPDSSSPEA